MRPFALAIAWFCFVPLAAYAGDVSAPSAAPAAQKAASPVKVGPTVINPEGQQGRIHTVVTGETLWDISEAYLGTPWVWPSLWKDDSGAASDGSIQPGDLLWISSTEIRRLSPAEVAAVRAAAPPAAMPDGQPDTGVAMGPIPGLGQWTDVQAKGFLASSSATVDFLASERLAAVGTIIGNPTPRAALGTGDAIYIDMGSGQVQVGDRLRIVRAQRNVPDPDSGRLLGTFVEPLAWAQVTVLEGEAATAVIHGAVSDVGAGDLLVPANSNDDPAALNAQSTPASVHGEIVHMVAERVIVGGLDVVYLDQGTNAGLAPGSALEVIRPGGMLYDTMRQRSVKVPDTVIGQLVVLSVHPSSSAAYVVHATTDLARGDYYRGAEVR